MAKTPPQKEIENGEVVAAPTSLTLGRMAYNDSVLPGESPGRGPRQDNTSSVPDRAHKPRRAR